MTILAESQYGEHLTALRQYDRRRIKLAELGGDGGDVPFEQAFSNLAHAYLRDKAPSLLDHEQGFQLLDRNQENTKAVGVFGFKVGSNQLFAPCFFLQGDLKGHELLYLKNQDLFCPLKENWLNYILNRKPNILGEGVDRKTTNLGVQSPELNRLSQSPYKYAAAMPNWAREFMPKYASMIVPGALEAGLTDFEQHCAEKLSLPDFLKQAGLKMLGKLVSTCMHYPDIAEVLEDMHGLDVVQQAIKSAGLRATTGSIFDDDVKMRVAVPVIKPIYDSVLNEKRADDDAKQKVKVLRFDDTKVVGLPEGMTEEDKEKLLKDSVLIEDHRDGEQVSVPYNVRVETKLFNPTETGLYEVLVKQGEFERCFIAMAPHGPNGRKSFCTVVRVGDKEKANWENIHATRVWCSSKIEGEDYDKWFSGLDTADALPESSKSRYMLLGQRGECSLPFKVEKSYGGEDGSTVYEVDFSTYCSRSNREGLHSVSHYDFDDTEYSSYTDGQRIHLNGKDGTRLRSSMGDLWAPTGMKKLVVKWSKSDEAASKEKKDSGGCGCVSSWDEGSSDALPIQPGNLVDAELAVMTHTKGLKVAHDGCEVWINDGGPLPPLEALIHLVVDHGFREKAARLMLKEAQSKRAIRVRVKYASPYLSDSAPSAPQFPEPMQGGGNPMGFAGATQQFQAEDVAIPGMSAANTDRNIYNVNPANTPDPMDASGIQRAGQTGQKEIFDTAMIGSMLKAVRDDTMIDRYLPDLIKGMDRLGRVLFMFYWHGDKFSERYGKADMPELEDSLRNAFEMMGDVILFLKQKTIEPYPEEGGMSLNLGSGSHD